jgi:hypothetical protein
VAVDWHLKAPTKDLLAVRDDEQRVEAASHGRRAAVVGRDIRREVGGCAKSGVSSAYLTRPSIFTFFRKLNQWGGRSRFAVRRPSFAVRGSFVRHVTLGTPVVASAAWCFEVFAVLSLLLFIPCLRSSLFVSHLWLATKHKYTLDPSQKKHWRIKGHVSMYLFKFLDNLLMDALPLPLSGPGDPMDALPMPPSDPVVTRIAACVRCSSRMGELRVYRGQGSPDRADRKGSIVQTVSSLIFVSSCTNAVSSALATAVSILSFTPQPT